MAPITPRTPRDGEEVRLSPHFCLSEFEASQTAARLGLRNEADGVQMGNLKRLAQHAEDIRSLLGHDPILISSGLRTLIVNGLVKGLITPADVPRLAELPDCMARLRADTSAHKDGLAMDFTCPGFGSPRDIVQRIADSSLPFDQLIYEGTWVHYAITRFGGKPRREVLTAQFKPGQPTRYVKGLL